MASPLESRTIVLATRNRGKLQEFSSLLGGAGFRLLNLNTAGIETAPEETGSTFPENARIKAVGTSLLTPLHVLADDSGLEVSALGDRPGVQSARYAGPDATDAERNQKLLRELECSGGPRDARFVCALALAREGAIVAESIGECRGVIAMQPAGTGGFGYDPLFFFPELGRTYAELSEVEKNRVSHRARAVEALLRLLARP